jgi:hypothetical protein
MMRPRRCRALLGALLLVLPPAACGRGADRSEASGDRPGAGSVAESPAASARSGQPFAFTEADLDAYERGLAKEMELVRAAQERERTAKTPEERAQATQAQWEDQTIPEGARSAGVPEQRYRQTRETVNRVLQTLDFQGKIDGPMEMDTAHASPAMRQRLTTDPFAELAPASATALRARMDRLVPLWSQYVRLTAVAG